MAWSVGGERDVGFLDTSPRMAQWTPHLISYPLFSTPTPQNLHSPFDDQSKKTDVKLVVNYCRSPYLRSSMLTDVDMFDRTHVYTDSDGDEQQQCRLSGIIGMRCAVWHVPTKESGSA
jgi:hypothetical protein